MSKLKSNEYYIKRNEYYIRSVENAFINEERRQASWREPECQKMYKELINYAGGFGNVRKGMRGQAKQYAITAYLKKEKPDFEKFKKRVELANGKRWR